MYNISDFVLKELRYMIHIANIWEDVTISAQIKCTHTYTVAAVAVSEGCSVVLFCALLKMKLRAISVLKY